MATFGFVSTAVAASSGSQLVPPKPFKTSKVASSDAQNTPSFAQYGGQGALVRVINAGKDAGEEQKAATASKPAKKAATKRRVASRKKTQSTAAVSQKRKDYSTLIRKAARKHGVPLEIAQAVVQVESNYNPLARGSHGEVGLMQIKPATARGLGYRGSVKALYDPETNLEWGMRYLAGAHERAGGDLCGTILRYNAGHFAKRMNPVSARYCKKVQTILARS